jgi:small subunit ribosomal protein S9
VGDPENDNTTSETPPQETPEPRVEERAETAEVVAAAEGEPAAPETGEAPAEEGLTAEPAPELVPAAVGAEKAYGTGRRKTSVARVYLRAGSGQLRVNGRPLEEVFTSPAWREHARGPLVFTGVADQYDASITVKGGGGNGQAGAIRQGLARALAVASPALRPRLRQNGFLTRDPRMKERKKYGQKGARKRFQWTKR